MFRELELSPSGDTTLGLHGQAIMVEIISDWIGAVWSSTDWTAADGTLYALATTGLSGYMAAVEKSTELGPEHRAFLRARAEAAFERFSGEMAGPRKDPVDERH